MGFEKKELYENFKKEYEEFDKLTQSKFTRWLKVWGRVKNYDVVEGKSGSKRTICFKEREKNPRIGTGEADLFGRKDGNSGRN